jgi:glutamine synthetase
MSDLWRDIFFPEAETGKEGGAGALAVLASYQNCCVAEYVWLDGKGQTRSKCKTMDKTPSGCDDCTIWTFNGACTDQAEAVSSDVYLVPRKVFTDPIRGAPHVLVVCECITQAMEPAKGNFRAECAEVMEKFANSDPWFGLEQEYVLMDDQGTPLTVAAGDNYCGRGALSLPKYMREIMGDHYAQCLSAGIKISGMNCESGRAQAEFQIGPCKGLNAGDHMIAARHTLHKCANRYRCAVSFKGYHSDIEVPSGMHVNFSSRETRGDGGLIIIEKVCRALGRRMKEAIGVYGGENAERLCGKKDTSEMNSFSFAIADRTASIRIPRSVGIVAKGYLEDRRPSANSDPYRVTAFVMKTAGEVLKATA